MLRISSLPVSIPRPLGAMVLTSDRQVQLSLQEQRLFRGHCVPREDSLLSNSSGPAGEAVLWSGATFPLDNPNARDSILALA